MAGLGVLGLPEWALPALAQGEVLVPFTDLPETFPAPTADRRQFDVRKIDGPLTPKDQFFTTQHYGHPEVDPATFRLKVPGLVDRPLSLSLDELRQMRSTELVAGFECSGNRRPLQGLSSNGRWTGVPLRAVLDQAGVKAEAREFVFFGADHGEEEVEFRGAEVQSRSAVRPQPVARKGAVAGADARLRAERRAADAPSGLAAAPARSRLVRRGEREVALARSTCRKTSTSASIRRAGIARCEAKRSTARCSGSKPRSRTCS